MIRPGPASIAAGVAPGGIVCHVYAVPTCELLYVSACSHDAETQALADADAVVALLGEWPGLDGVCLVVYDGDTGERLTRPT